MGMSTAEILNFAVSAVGAIATVLATFAAFKSASSAKEAHKALAEEQARSAEALKLERLSTGWRDVSNLVAASAFEMERIRFLAATQQFWRRSQAVLTGSLGGSRESVAQEEINRRLANAESAYALSKPLLEHPGNISKLDAAEVSAIQTVLPIKIALLRAIAEEMALDNNTLEAQFLQLREQSFKSNK